MITRTWSACLDGASGQKVQIEASRQSESGPAIHITGLAGDIVRESRERVRACLRGYGFDLPSGKLVVNLSPAATKKQGSQLDLGMAMALAGAEGYLPQEALLTHAFLGELSLTGQLLPINQALPLLDSLLDEPQLFGIVVPAANESELRVLNSKKIIPCENIGEVLTYLNDGERPKRFFTPRVFEHQDAPSSFDKVLGHSTVKRAVEIALSGNHHLLMIGPPGSGKTLMAESIPELLSPLCPDEILEVMKIYSLAGMAYENIFQRPYRSPHHSISSSAFLGGGSGTVVPGEVSLAHRGVLFLDEFAEFRRDCIEGLRQPLQSGIIHLHRVSRSVSLPAEFLLIAAMNPCPCGFKGSKYRVCHCSPENLNRYRKKLSGPLLDRFDLCVWMDSTPLDLLAPSEPKAETVRASVRRLSPLEKKGDLESESASLSSECRAWVSEYLGKSSHRSLLKVLRVSKTIARLNSRKDVQVSDLAEAWTYRVTEKRW